MTAKADFLESWSRLDAGDLAAVNIAFANNRLREISLELSCYLGARLVAEVAHRQEMRTIPVHALPWEVVDNGKLAQCYLGAMAIKRAAIQTERLVEWADLMMQTICTEMAQRLADSQRMAEQMMVGEN